MARGAEALLLLTEWKEYRQLDWARVQSEMARPLVLDARNMLPPAQDESFGFRIPQLWPARSHQRSGIRINVSQPSLNHPPSCARHAALSS